MPVTGLIDTGYSRPQTRQKRRYNMANQRHDKNPRVDRVNRKSILEKRIRGLKKRKLVRPILIKKLNDYEGELTILGK